MTQTCGARAVSRERVATTRMRAYIRGLGREIAVRLANIGRLPLCNQKADRAPRIGRLCFPLCWRCTGILLGLLVGTLTLQPLLRVEGHALVAILLCTPCAVDALVQRWFHIESTTYRRMATGLLTGVAIAIF